MRIGVDVGGTFTDLIVLDEETGEVTVEKAPSMPRAVDVGVRNVVAGALSSDQVADATHFLHGTTVGLNALLERRGARVGILTTEGFRDVLETRRLLRVDERGERVWDRLFKTPDPLVARPLRLGVRERIGADGSVLADLDREAVAQAAATFTEQSVECVAIVFINSHANPSHELAAAGLLTEAGFVGEISLSHRVTGQYREYERTSTTVIDAYVRPAVAGYLEQLEAGLGEERFDGEFLITTSSGGCIAFGEARSRPFETVMSGPVAGAVGASSLCQQLEIGLAITADVGGTSFDTCLLVEGRPTVKHEGEVVGMPLQTPWVDVRSVGAGGGSIAYVEHGLLHVGPRSAGADPGPVCYGRGGSAPTVTDAAVVLGMLARETLASGMSLDVDGARDSLERLGASIGLDAQRAARGVMRIAGASMAGAIRAVSTEVGQDPRDAALIAFGGAGPLFTSLLARELGVGTIVVPRHAGNFSAWGLLDQDVVRSAARTILAPLDESGLRRVEPILAGLFAMLEERVENRIAGAVRREAEFDLRYRGQEYSLAVAVGLRGIEVADDAAVVAGRFATAYERTYGHSFGVGVEIVSVRAIERTVLPSISARSHPHVNGGRRSPDSVSAFSFRREQWCDFAVIDRVAMAPGERFSGPAIALEPTTTSYLDAGFEVTVHEQGALIASDADLDHAGRRAS
jgi:N-methylhydantoinase A